MTRISVFSDISSESSLLEKGVLEIVNASEKGVDTAIINFDLLEYSEVGIELRFLFRGKGELKTPKIQRPIILITSVTPKPDSKEITIRLGRDECKKLKVTIENSEDMVLEEVELLSKNSYFLSKKEVYATEDAVKLSLDDEEDKECSYEIPLGEEVFSFRKKDIRDQDNLYTDVYEEDVSIEGKIFYVKAKNSRLPRNVCLNGIRIKLYNEENKLISTRITRKRGKENGHFKFASLEKGKYKLKFLIPCNLEIVKETCDDIIDDLAYVSFDNNDSKYLKIGVIKRGE